MSTAGSIAVVGVKVYFIGVEAFKVIKASPIVGTALVAGAVGVKGALHEEIAVRIDSNFDIYFLKVLVEITYATIFSPHYT